MKKCIRLLPMCGFFGCLHLDNIDFKNSNFQSISNLINHRGPDYSGYSFSKINNDHLKLSHKRLSIQDLTSSGNQPILSPNGNLVLLFNGEIYNHYELRSLLSHKTEINWNGHSDTETLINLFDNFNFETVLSKVKGMFSIILIDYRKKKLLMARDVAGEKPLYLLLSHKFIGFASDIKPLSRIPEFEKKICKKALNYYLKLNYIPSPNTIYESIFKLPQASFLEIDLTKYKKKYYRDFNNFLNSYGITFNKYKLTKNNEYNNTATDPLKQLDNTLFSSVKSQLISDAPLGTFLSGGIDSSLITSIASKIKSNIDTFTIGYDFENYDESKNAEIIAKHLKTNHHTHICTKNDVIDKLSKINDAFSEPFADSSQIPTMLVSEIASQKIKVALSGDGGDEIFCGYNRYIIANKIKNYLFFFPYSIRKLFLNIFNKLPINYKIFFFKKFININDVDFKLKIDLYIRKLLSIKNEYDLYDSFITEWHDDEKLLNYKLSKNDNFSVNKYFNGNKNIIEKMMIADFNLYLPDDILCKVDRSSMFYSLETRAPYLDSDVISFGNKLHLSNKINKINNKVILRDLLKKYIPNKCIHREKKGFGIPLGEWMRLELKDYTIDNLSKNSINRHGFFNYQVVSEALNNHLNGSVDNTNKLWSIIVFNKWYEKNF